MQEEKQSGRLEGFSDGVFGIAMTLLVLELRVPEHSGNLAHDLALLAPKYFAFALSFATILIMWVNHHGLFLYVHKFDAHTLFSNGLLLLFVTFMPFPTAVLGDHLLDTGNDGKLAAALYALSFVAINISWILMWHSIRHRRHVVAPRITDHDVRTIDRSLLVGICAYTVAATVALVDAKASAALVVLIAVFWTVQAFRRHEVMLA